MSDFLPYWNLNTKPFEATWDTRFYYRSPQHLEALERLFYLTHERSMSIGMLSGEIGCGKTITGALLAQALSPAEFLTMRCDISDFEFNDLLLAVLRRLEPSQASIPDGKFARCERLREICASAAAGGRHVVMLFDEAHDMQADTLRQLSSLTNFNGDGQALLTLILIGQPPLRQLVNSNPSIQQRVGLRFHLKPLDATDTSTYIRHRLQIAGHETGAVFDDDALSLMHYLTSGIPREINRAAKLCLEHAWAAGSTSVTRRLLKDLALDIHEQDEIFEMEGAVPRAS